MDVKCWRNQPLTFYIIGSVARLDSCLNKAYSKLFFAKGMKNNDTPPLLQWKQINIWNEKEFNF